MSSRYNILLIISEDNGQHLGCYGDPYAQTPHIDKLASEGVRFENMYATQAVCSPGPGEYSNRIISTPEWSVRIGNPQVRIAR